MVVVYKYLFPGEYVLIEVKLDLLIGYVDAELLKRVLLEVFKAKDVQDADIKTLVILSRGGRRRVRAQTCTVLL